MLNLLLVPITYAFSWTTSVEFPVEVHICWLTLDYKLIVKLKSIERTFSF